MLFALFGQETARENKTKAMIAKLNAIIMAKYESYRTRRVPIVLYPPNASDANYAVYSKTFVYEAARARLDVLRDIMRMELPDHWIDVTNPPLSPGNMYNPAFNSSVSSIGSLARPAASQAYINAYSSAATLPTQQYEGAECLYLIVTLGTADNLGGPSCSARTTSATSTTMALRSFSTAGAGRSSSSAGRRAFPPNSAARRPARWPRVEPARSPATAIWPPSTARTTAAPCCSLPAP